MSDAAIQAFTAYFGSPAKMAAVVILALISVFVIAVLIIVRHGVNELNENETMDETDLLFIILRALAVMLITAIFIGF